MEKHDKRYLIISVITVFAILALNTGLEFNFWLSILIGGAIGGIAALMGWKREKDKEI